MRFAALLGFAVFLVVVPGCGSDDGPPDPSGDAGAPDAGARENEAPVATIEAPADGAEVRDGDTVTFRGTASDADHDAADLRATWSAGARVLCAAAPVAADGTSECEAEIGLGDTSIRLEVRDPDGATGSDTITLRVLTAGSPSVEILTPDGSRRHYADVPVELTAVIGDPEDAPTALAVRWTDAAGAELDVDDTADASGNLAGTRLFAEGSHAVTLTVTDTTGLEASATVSFDVGGPNVAPTCAITAPADGLDIGTGAEVVLAGTVIDPDVEETLLTASWSSDRDGALGASAVAADGSVGAATSALSAGLHTLTLSGADELGATCTASITVHVGTGPVVVIDAPASGAVVRHGATVSFSATVSDDFTSPDALALSWQSDRDGVLDTSAASAAGTAAFGTSTLSVGAHTVTLTATDGAGLEGSASVSVVVDGVPSAPGVAILPASPNTTDELVASIVTPSIDPEGGSITYQYAWSVDGGATSSTAPTIPASATARGQVWTVVVTPYDELGAGPSATASVTIGNAAPSLASVALSPSAATETTTLTCTPGATADADGDAVALSYAWLVNGSVIAATSTTLGGAFFDAGDVVACRVTPRDATSAGAPVTSGAVTIANTPPGAPSVSITPSSGVAGVDRLECQVTTAATDVDGDSLSYAFTWTVDGNDYPADFPGATGPGTTTRTGDTVPAADTLLGARWTCTVTASDAGGPGGSASATASVCGSGVVRPACSGQTVQVGYLPGWSFTHDGSSSLAWTSIETGSLTYGGCTIDITSVASDFTLATLSAYDAIIISDPSGGSRLYTAAEQQAIREYLEGGHGGAYGSFLVSYMTYDNSALMDLFGVDRSTVTAGETTSGLAATVVDPSHPVMQGVPGSFGLLSYGYQQSNAGGWAGSDLLTCAQFVATGAGQSSIIAYEGPGWRSVYFTGMPEYNSAGADARRAIYNALLWAAGYQ